MTHSKIPEPLATILSTYCDVNAFEMVDCLHGDIRNKKIALEDARLFKEQLRDAIVNKTITTHEYKSLTGDSEYITQEDLQGWLRELWSKVFPNDVLD